MQDEINCDKGWHGSCCCNCVNFSKVFKHPCNTEDWSKGSCSETMGWVCVLPEELDNKTDSHKLHVTYSSSGHGMCELHYPIPERKKYLENIENAKKFGLGL